MARPLRLEYPGAWHHVMNRGANLLPIFTDSADRKLFFKTLEEAVHQWGIRVHAYSLMTNHYHLLLETPLGNLSRALRHTDGVYTQRFNRRHHRDGPLLRGRFKSILIDKESYLLELVRYIHLNGVRALLYRSPAEDPYCSHRAYIGAEPVPEWLTTGAVLSQFGKEPDVARQELDRFVWAGVSSELQRRLEAKRRPAVLGSKAFVDRIRERFRVDNHPHRETPQAQDLLRIYNPQEVLVSLAGVCGVGLKSLLEPRRTRRNKPRRAAMYLLRSICRLTYADIGKLLGGISYATVAKIVLKGDEDQRREWDQLCTEILERLKAKT